MRWVVGDIQGCAREFEKLLAAIRFDPGQDELWCLGDLINRGPDSLAVLQLWQSVGGCSLMGNHEINALLSHSGRRPKKLKHLKSLFQDPDVDSLMAELRALPVLVHLPARGAGPDAWIVHAGFHPSWRDLHEISMRLIAEPHTNDWLESQDVHFATNVRCCNEAGEQCDFTGPPEDCPPHFRPWDSFYGGDSLVVHGHWANRGYYRTAHTMGLDSGCVYGGALTAWCQDEDRIVRVRSHHVD